MIWMYIRGSCEYEAGVGCQRLRAEIWIVLHRKEGKGRRGEEGTGENQRIPAYLYTPRDGPCAGEERGSGAILQRPP